MLKFLRRYNKIILAVGGVLLMVVFLVPQAMQNLGQSASTFVIATLASGEEITEADLQEAGRELDVLDGVNALPLLQTSGREHWLLLSREAERGGFVGGPQDGRVFLRTLAEGLVQYQMNTMFNPNITGEQFAQQVAATLELLERRRAGMIGPSQTEDFVDQTLAKAHGVIRMYNAYLASSQLSDLESMRILRDYFDEVEIEHAIVKPDRWIPDAPEPAEEEILAHFEKYKNDLPGRGEHGFGYMIEPAVAIERIQIDRSAIEDAVVIDPVDASVFWRSNRPRFPKEFAEERARVEKELRTQKANEAMTAAQEIALREMTRERQGLKEDGRFKVLPDGWAGPSYQAIADDINARLAQMLGTEGAFANVRQPTSLFTPDAASIVLSNDEILNSQAAIGPNPVPFLAFAFSVREVNPASPLGLQKGLTAPTTTRSAGGDIFFFRVTNARPQAPPQSVDQVRSEIVEDLRRLWAFNHLSANAEQFRQEAVADFYRAAADHGAQVAQHVNVRRTGMQGAEGAPVDGALNVESARDAILEKAEGLDPTVLTTDLPAEQRTLALPLPRGLSLGLVRITLVRPISLEHYLTRDSLSQRIASGQRLQNPVADLPFTLEQMMTRHGFKYARGGASEDEESDPAPGSTPGPGPAPAPGSEATPEQTQVGAAGS